MTLSPNSKVMRSISGLVELIIRCSFFIPWLFSHQIVSH